MVKWSAAIRASELQGKYLKMFSDHFEIAGHSSISDLSDEELVAELGDLVTDPAIAALIETASKKPNQQADG